MIGVVLAVILAQPVIQPETIALTLNQQTEFTRTVDAQRLYEAIEAKDEGRLTDEDRRLHAALTLALGTLPDARQLARCDAGHQSLCETQRGIRRPLQNPRPDDR